MDQIRVQIDVTNPHSPTLRLWQALQMDASLLQPYAQKVTMFILSLPLQAVPSN